MTLLWINHRPDVLYVVEWTDAQGEVRLGVSSHKKDVESKLSEDAEARIVEGKVTWDER